MQQIERTQTNLTKALLFSHLPKTVSIGCSSYGLVVLLLRPAGCSRFLHGLDRLHGFHRLHRLHRLHGPGFHGLHRAVAVLFLPGQCLIPDPGLCHDFLALFEIREPELVPAFRPHFRVGAADHVAASHGTKFEAECTGLRTNTAAGECP